MVRSTTVGCRGEAMTFTRTQLLLLAGLLSLYVGATWWLLAVV